MGPDNMKASEYNTREELDQAVTARSGQDTSLKDYQIECTAADLERLQLSPTNTVWGVSVRVIV